MNDWRIVDVWCWVEWLFVRNKLYVAGAGASPAAGAAGQGYGAVTALGAGGDIPLVCDIQRKTLQLWFCLLFHIRIRVFCCTTWNFIITNQNV